MCVWVCEGEGVGVCVSGCILVTSSYRNTRIHTHTRAHTHTHTHTHAHSESEGGGAEEQRTVRNVFVASDSLSLKHLITERYEGSDQDKAG